MQRDSNTQNAFLRSQHGRSPSSNNKSLTVENGGKSSLRMTMNNDQHRNMQNDIKNNGLFSNLSNLADTGLREHDYGMNFLLNREQKDKIQ
jgi:hypothetical protein